MGSRCGSARRSATRVGHRLAIRREPLAHLRRAREVVLGAGQPEALLLLSARTGLEAEQDVVRLGVLRLDVVRVVGGHERQPGPTRDLDKAGADRVLLGDAVVLQLEKVVVGAEDLRVLARDRLGRVEVAAHDRLRQLTTETRGQADQPLGVLGEQLLVDARLVVVALEVRRADQLDEVAIPDVVARQQDQMVRIAVGASLAIGARARRHVHLAAEDRVDLRGACRRVELNRSVEHAVVGDRDCRLAHRLRACR